MSLRMLAAAAVVFVFAQPALAADPIVIKFSHVVAADTPKVWRPRKVRGVR